VVLEGKSGTYSAGNIEGHSALMVPLVYQSGTGAVGSDDFASIRFDVHYDQIEAHKKAVVPPAADASWAPILNGTVEVVRASINSGQEHDDALDRTIPADPEKKN
jgi:hypothetical protein